MNSFLFKKLPTNYLFTNKYIYIYIYTHGAFNKFPDFFVQAFKIFVDS